MKARQWYRARIRWAEMVEGRNLSMTLRHLPA